MASRIAFALLVPLAATGALSSDRGTFRSDSALVRVARLGPPAPAGAASGSIGDAACGADRDSAAPAAEWFRVDVTVEGAGSPLTFPVDGEALRGALSQACRAGEEGRDARIADALRALAERLRVRMKDAPGEPAE